MREIYTAPTVEAAADPLRRVRRASGEQRYPAMIDTWETAWDEFVPVPRVPRRAAQDRLHDQRHRVPQRPVPQSGPTPRPLPQRASRAEGALPRRHPKREEPANLTGKINGWKNILNALTIHYGDRIAAQPQLKQ